jgi:hypothetical protein
MSDLRSDLATAKAAVPDLPPDLKDQIGDVAAMNALAVLEK